MNSPLTDFFQGTLSLDELRGIAKERIYKVENTKSISGLEQSTQIFRLSTIHLIQLCDLTIAGQVSSEELSDLAFWIQAADEVDWDEADEVITETLFDWANPEVNFPLTPATLKRFRERLMTGDLSVTIE